MKSRKYSSSNEQFWDTFQSQDFFLDNSLTVNNIPDISWHVPNSLTFPGFTDKWSPWFSQVFPDKRQPCTFEDVGHLADVSEVASFTPRVDNVHQMRLERLHVLFLREVQKFSLSAHLGYASRRFLQSPIQPKLRKLNTNHAIDR